MIPRKRINIYDLIPHDIKKKGSPGFLGMYNIINNFTQLGESFNMDEKKRSNDRIKYNGSYRFSETWTPFKQQGLFDILRLQIKVVERIIKKYPWALDSYRYIDLNSGPGYHEKAGEGSPIIALKLAMRSKIKFDFNLYEIDEKLRLQLIDQIGKHPTTNVRSFVFGDHHDMTFSRPKKPMFGIVYSDPTDEKHPIELLNRISQICPHIDILISTAANKSGMKTMITNRKLSEEQREGSRLSNRIIYPIQKKFWFVRDLIPGDGHQWTLLLGTNWDKWPDMEIYDFHRTDSPVGIEIMQKLDHTKEELKLIKLQEVRGY